MSLPGYKFRSDFAKHFIAFGKAAELAKARGERVGNIDRLTREGMFLWQVRELFETPTRAIKKRVRKASDDEIARWVARSFTAKTLAEVMNDP